MNNIHPYFLEKIKQAKATRSKQLDLSTDRKVQYDKRFTLPTLTRIPPEIFEMTWLESLDLSYNDFIELPEEIGRLTNLRQLKIKSWRTLPDDKKLRVLPESIGRLTQLTDLDVGGNQLTALPESIGRLTQLTILDVIGNQLTALPESIGRLTQLTDLDVSDNQLTALPESIVNLTKLSAVKDWGGFR